MIKLSKRLEHIASYIPKGSRFADIGSDHAYLCSYVCLQDESAWAIAGEVREGPLKAANATIQKYHLQSSIDVRLGDGLNVIKSDDQVDTIVIAGMGGKLITDILRKDFTKRQQIRRLIIQPNTNPELVRKLFIEMKFSLKDETIIADNQHIYEILVAEQGADNVYDTSSSIEKQIYFGPLLMRKNSPVFKRKLAHEYEHITRVINQLEKSKQQNQ